MATQPDKPFLNLLFSQPRTCSNLITRILNLPAQPTVHKHPGDGYFFMDILGARFTKLLTEGIGSFKSDEVPEYYSILQRCVESMESWVKDVESTGKGCFVKQHVCWMIDPVAETAFLESLGPDLAGETYDFGGANANKAALKGERSAGNETVLPDTLLMTFRPTILIRHPALAFPSLVRTSIKISGSSDADTWQLTYHWSKVVYDWYSANLSEVEKRTAIEGVQFPIVLDADDINGPDLVEKYAEAVGMDVNLLRWTWPAATPQEIARQPKAIALFVETLSKSQGVIKSKGIEEIDLAKEKEKWIAEFGEKLGERLGVLVDKAMPEYEWLKERRLRA